jgi:hypothetical protein
MRLMKIVALLAVMGCSSALKRELSEGPPPGYLEALARDEGITVEEARKRLVESRVNPPMPPQPGRSRAVRQPTNTAARYGARPPANQLPK